MRGDPNPAPPPVRGTRWAIAGAVLLAGLLRLPFVFTGLSPDEGGYAYVAQQWSRGARLYDTAWLDRPQGLLLAYRGLLWLHDSGWTIRLGMVLAGMIVTAALGAAGWLLAGRRTGILAAGGYAVVGVAPHLDGMTLNGELLASVPSTVSIALALAWWRRNRTPWWLLAAGLCAGAAITMKQSGFDGIVAGLVIVALSARSRAWHLGVFLAGVATPVLACVLHGIWLGWSRYWTALAGYQFAAIGANGGGDPATRWSDFVHHTPDAAGDLIPLLVVSLFGWRPLDRGGRWTLGAWLGAGFVGVNLGGSYWPHYYVQILPPLVLLVATAVAAVPARWRRRALAAAVLLPTVAWLAALVPMSPAQRATAIPGDAVASRDDRIAARIEATTSPSDRIYVLESEAYLQFAAQRVSPYPYLWGKPIEKIPDALPRMRAMLTSPHRPRLVILHTPDPNRVDPTGAVSAALTRGQTDPHDLGLVQLTPTILDLYSPD